MHIFFRVDSSVKIGTGHVMRCLTMAKRLQEKGAQVSFICRDLKGNINEMIQSQGFTLYELNTSGEDFDWKKDAEMTSHILQQQQKINWLIIDHYDIDIKWESTLRADVQKIMVIDDLANRPHECDILLDYNFYIQAEKRYDGLVPPRTLKLLGQNYLTLRDEFIKARKNLNKNYDSINRLLISFGGTDETNETLKALKAVEQFSHPLTVDVVVGATNEHQALIKDWCSKYQYVNYHSQVDDMATLMKHADVAIGAGGSSSYERCYLGLPTLVIETATNQRELIHSLQTYGVIHFLGEAKDVSEADITHTLQNMIKNKALIHDMSLRCLSLFEHDMNENKVINHLLEG